jgi:hypothetical protein
MLPACLPPLNVPGLPKCIEAERLVVRDEVGNIALVATVDQCATMNPPEAYRRRTRTAHRMDSDRPRRRGRPAPKPSASSRLVPR